MLKDEFATHSGLVLNWLLRFVPEKNKAETHDFIRACIVMLAPAVFSLATYMSLYDQPLLYTPTYMFLALNALPILLWKLKSTKIAGSLLIVIEYVLSYRMMELVGPEFGYATPAFFLPLAAALLVNTVSGIVCGVLSLYMVLLVPYGFVPFYRLLETALPLCEDCINELAFRGVLNNMFVIVAIGLLYSWLNDAAVRRLQFMNHLSQQFFAVICHELRGPCQSIVNGTNLLAAGTNLTEDQRQLASAIDQSGQSLSALLNDVLDFEKIEQGELLLAPDPLPLRSFIEGVVEMAGLAAPARPVEFVCHLARDLPEAIIADAVRLRQVFMNLMSNALKFTESGAVVVSVSRVHENSSSKFPNTVVLQVDVTDTGVGIAQEEQAKLFQPFTTIIREESAKRYAGTGLGLSVCMKLVHMMGGDINVTSAKGLGSCFSFTVRVGLVNDPHSVAAFQPPLDASALRGSNALVAMDPLSARQVVMSMLREKGMHVTGVDMADAVTAASQNCYQFCIVDRESMDAVAAALAKAAQARGETFDASSKPSCFLIGLTRGGSSLQSRPSSTTQGVGLSTRPQEGFERGGSATGSASAAPQSESGTPTMEMRTGVSRSYLVRPITDSRLISAMVHAFTGAPQRETTMGMSSHPHPSLTRMAISASVLQPQFFSLHNPSAASTTTGVGMDSGVSGAVYTTGNETSRRTQQRRNSTPAGAISTAMPQQKRPQRRNSVSFGEVVFSSTHRQSDHGRVVLPPFDSRAMASLPQTGQETRRVSDNTDSETAPTTAAGAAPSPVRQQEVPRVSLSTVEGAVTPVHIPSPAPVIDGPLHGLRVLAVDDTRTSRFITVRMLKKLGARPVLEAENGRDAERMFKENHLDVVLLDMHLPDMTGLEVARLIRAVECGRIMHTTGSGATTSPRGSAAAALQPAVSSQNCIVIALSGDADVESDCVAGGLMDSFLLKPASLEQIQRAVLDALDRRRATAASPPASR